MSASENNWPNYPFVRWPFIPFVQFLWRQQNNSIIYRNWVPGRLLVSDKPVSSIISQPTTNNSDFVPIFIILRWYLHHNPLPSSSYFAIFVILWRIHHTSTSPSYFVAIFVIIGAQTLVSCAQNKDEMENLQPRVESLYFCYKIQLKKKDNMCVRCLATIPRVNPFSEWLCACSVSKCANVNRNDCENIFGKKWVSMWVTGTCRTEFGMQRNFFSS